MLDGHLVQNGGTIVGDSDIAIGRDQDLVKACDHSDPAGMVSDAAKVKRMKKCMIDQTYLLDQEKSWWCWKQSLQRECGTVGGGLDMDRKHDDT